MATHMGSVHGSIPGFIFYFLATALIKRNPNQVSKMAKTEKIIAGEKSLVHPLFTIKITIATRAIVIKTLKNVKTGAMRKP